MLRAVRAASVEKLETSGNATAMPSPSSVSFADTVEVEEPLPSGGDVNEFGRINSTVMNPDWMNEPDEILEEISDEEIEEVRV